MNKYWITGLLAVALLINVSACKTFRIGSFKKKDKKEVLKKVLSDTTAAKPVVHPPVITAEKQQLMNALDGLWTKELNYKTFSGKAKMHYEGPAMKQEFTAHFRLKKDSAMWVNVTALEGLVQVARVYITPDTIKMINYLNKEATIMPMSQAQKLLPVPLNFMMLQNFVVGNALVHSGHITDATDIGNAWTIQVEDNNYVQQITYNKPDSTMRSGQMHTRNVNGPQGISQYDNYGNVDGRKFSEDRTVHIQNNGQEYMLDMSFNKADFDVDQDYPFSIPGNYTINK
ncbi:MAG: DUF4292 domain-containing protein [Bacteroidetes bacterium]|nr:DUF4292 domain-containing protein [Bacteroidota bacterium]